MFKLFITTPLVVAMCSLPVVGQPVTPRPTSPPKSPSVQPKDSKEKTIAELGEEAPEFELVDQFGKTHKLENYKGKVVVLEWFNDKCPVCKNVWDSGLISELVADLNNLCQNPDATTLPLVVYLAINSSANRPEEEVLKSGAEFIEEAEVEIPMLMDYDGKVGKAYGARTTPHMFIIDTEGILVYQGALSDDPRGKEGKDADTHVTRAIHQLIKGEEIAPNYVQPWGCSVKYKRGSGSGRRGPIGRPRK
jgi:peroxiredoxin